MKRLMWIICGRPATWEFVDKIFYHEEDGRKLEFDFGNENSHPLSPLLSPWTFNWMESIWCFEICKCCQKEFVHWSMMAYKTKKICHINSGNCLSWSRSWRNSYFALKIDVMDCFFFLCLVMPIQESRERNLAKVKPCTNSKKKRKNVLHDQ